MESIEISVIIPARNEEACIGETIQAIVDSAKHFESGLLDEQSSQSFNPQVEILVVDNLSTDRTSEVINSFAHSSETKNLVRLVNGQRLSTPCARNDGVEISKGSILIFVDADTLVPKDALCQVSKQVVAGKGAGICLYRSSEPGFRAWCWWTFWNYVRLLPLPRAKAMPAFMFCTREVFEQLGPFDETVVIGEEWPILAEMYRTRRCEFVYDRSLVVQSSSRRMAQQKFGYVRTLSKWVWAVLHVSGRRKYRADIR